MGVHGFDDPVSMRVLCGVREPSVRLCLINRCGDRLCQHPRRFRRKLDRNSRTRTLGLIDKINVQRMVQLDMIGTIIRPIDPTQVKSAFQALTTALDLRLVENVGTHGRAPFS